MLLIKLNRVALFIYAKLDPKFTVPLHIAISCWNGDGVGIDWVLYIVKGKYDAWQVGVLDVEFDEVFEVDIDILKVIGGWK